MNTEQLSHQAATAEEPSQASRVERIAALNDRLRRTGQGGGTCVTRGVAALDADQLAQVIYAVVGFTAFGPDNDPWGEHDGAAVEVAGLTVMWKIDYYDRAQSGLSPDPADPRLTARILTIMLASEY